MYTDDGGSWKPDEQVGRTELRAIIARSTSYTAEQRQTLLNLLDTFDAVGTDNDSVPNLSPTSQAQ